MFCYYESLVWMHLGFPKIPLFQGYSLAVAIATKTYPFRTVNIYTDILVKYPKENSYFSPFNNASQFSMNSLFCWCFS